MGKDVEDGEVESVMAKQWVGHRGKSQGHLHGPDETVPGPQRAEISELGIEMNCKGRLGYLG